MRSLENPIPFKISFSIRGKNAAHISRTHFKLASQLEEVPSREFSNDFLMHFCALARSPLGHVDMRPTQPNQYSVNQRRRGNIWGNDSEALSHCTRLFFNDRQGLIAI